MCLRSLRPESAGHTPVILSRCCRLTNSSGVTSRAFCQGQSAHRASILCRTADRLPKRPGLVWVRCRVVWRGEDEDGREIAPQRRRDVGVTLLVSRPSGNSGTLPAAWLALTLSVAVGVS